MASLQELEQQRQRDSEASDSALRRELDLARQRIAQFEAETAQLRHSLDLSIPQTRADELKRQLADATAQVKEEQHAAQLATSRADRHAAEVINLKQQIDDLKKESELILRSASPMPSLSVDEHTQSHQLELEEQMALAATDRRRLESRVSELTEKLDLERQLRVGNADENQSKLKNK
eukprot:GABV01000996.1.p1 GENE.GABV01000996.1~~GABV01000996.1.p1  ORF type:complete len:178 (+),score=37.86 GABV01000996.1:482-1015(+)